MTAQGRPDHHPVSPSPIPPPGSVPRERREVALEPSLNGKQTADLTSLLAAVSVQARLGSGYREEAEYWAGQVGSGLHADDLQSIAWLLEDVAGSPWLPDPLQQWASAWATTLRELTNGLGAD